MKTAIVSTVLLLAATSASAKCLYCDQDDDYRPKNRSTYESTYTPIVPPPPVYTPPASVPFTARSEDGQTRYYGSVDQSGSFSAYSPNRPGRIYGQIYGN